MTTTADNPHIGGPTSAAAADFAAPPDVHAGLGIALDGVLEGRRAFDLARGALVELSGGTERAAANVLSHLAAQLCLPATAVGAFFLACLAAQDTDNPTWELVRRVVKAASPPDHHTGQPVTEHVHRLCDIEPTDHIVSVIETAALDGERGIAFRGELDMATRPALEAAAATRHVATDTRMLLDLRDLSFCDIAGIRALSTVAVHVAARGGTLHIRPPSALSSRRMLHLAVASGWLPSEFACIETA